MCVLKPQTVIGNAIRSVPAPPVQSVNGEIPPNGKIWIGLEILANPETGNIRATKEATDPPPGEAAVGVDDRTKPALLCEVSLSSQSNAER